MRDLLARAFSSHQYHMDMQTLSPKNRYKIVVICWIVLKFNQAHKAKEDLVARGIDVEQSSTVLVKNLDFTVNNEVHTTES